MDLDIMVTLFVLFSNNNKPIKNTHFNPEYVNKIFNL